MCRTMASDSVLRIETMLERLLAERGVCVVLTPPSAPSSTANGSVVQLLCLASRDVALAAVWLRAPRSARNGLLDVLRGLLVCDAPREQRGLRALRATSAPMGSGNECLLRLLRPSRARGLAITAARCHWPRGEPLPSPAAAPADAAVPRARARAQTPPVTLAPAACAWGVTAGADDRLACTYDVGLPASAAGAPLAARR